MLNKCTNVKTYITLGRGYRSGLRPLWRDCCKLNRRDRGEILCVCVCGKGKIEPDWKERVEYGIRVTVIVNRGRTSDINRTDMMG